MERPLQPTPPPLAGRAIRLWPFVLAAALVVAGATVVHRFDPLEHAFYPRCLLHQWTGLQCPGCGTLRALHQLTHGRLAAAFALNPLLVAALPFALWAGLRVVFGQRGGRLLPAAFSRPLAVWIALAGVAAFTVARNLPGDIWSRLVP